MPDETDKAESSAEQAYAAAVETVPVKPRVAEAKPPVTPEIVPVKVRALEPKLAPAPASKTTPAKAKSVPKRKARPVKPAKAVRPKTASVPLKSPQAQQTPTPKEPLMAKQADFTKTVTDAIAELQTRTKAAYDKSAELAGEANEFTKGNIEALVESSKIVTENLQDLGKAYADEAKAAFETLTADMKEFAAVKSPTELFQLQGRLMRRNFDTLVAFGSKSSETMVKLTNEAIAPLSSRASLAAEKFSKAA